MLWFKELLLLEKFVLVCFSLGLLSWIWLFKKNVNMWWQETKQLLWPSYVFRMLGFISREKDEANLIGQFIKGSFIFAYIPTVIWATWWIISSFLPVGEYLSLVMPMTASRVLAMLGFRIVEIDFILIYTPLPIFFSQSQILMVGCSLAWAMICNVRLNKLSQAYFKRGDFKKDFLVVLKSQNAFVEARENKMPYVRDDKRGHALVNTKGVSLTPQKVKELAPILESNLGCWITKVEQTRTPDSMLIGYRYRPFPEMIKFNPEAHKHPNPRFVVMGTDTRNLVGHTFSKDANVLVTGLMNKGKSVALSVMSVSMFNQNPNTILIVLDPTKGAIDFGFLKYEPKERREYLEGKRDRHEIHSLDLVLVISDRSKVERVLEWVVGEIERRKNLCGDVDHLVGNMKKLYDNPQYRGEKQPYIYLMTDEHSLLQQMAGDHDETNFNSIIKTGRAFDINCILATQEPYQKDLGRRRNLLMPYSFFLPMDLLKLTGLDLAVPNEAGVFAHRTEAGGIALAKGFYLDDNECAPFIAEQTKKANRTTHRLFQELVAHVNQTFPDDMMEKVERKLQTSTIGHREPVITGNFREAA